MKRSLVMFVARAVVLFGFCIYAFLLYDGYIEWQQNISIHQSRVDEFLFLIGLVFGAGLPPLVVAAARLWRANTIRNLGGGLALVALFIIAHYVALVMMAHGSWHAYVPIALVESSLAVAVVFVARGRQ